MTPSGEQEKRNRTVVTTGSEQHLNKQGREGKLDCRYGTLSARLLLPSSALSASQVLSTAFQTTALRYQGQGQLPTAQMLAAIATFPSLKLEKTQHMGNIMPIIESSEYHHG